MIQLFVQLFSFLKAGCSGLYPWLAAAFLETPVFVHFWPLDSFFSSQHLIISAWENHNIFLFLQFPSFCQRFFFCWCPKNSKNQRSSTFGRMNGKSRRRNRFLQTPFHLIKSTQPASLNSWTRCRTFIQPIIHYYLLRD